MDWSTSQILAVSGHERMHDVECDNQILFYNRTGQLLYNLHIPDTSCPLSALCWAHGDQRLFIACGTAVYTAWVILESFPSMLKLCQMKVKQQILRNSLYNIEKLILPPKLKHQLCELYRSTIKGFIPNKNTLRTFVCEPLKQQLRLQCTMKRVDHNNSNNDTNDNEFSSASLSSSSNNNNGNGATYVLYLEYLGGLIPLLSAKRVSKICPDFIIFDPQEPVTDKSDKTPIVTPTHSFVRPRSNTFHNMPSINSLTKKSLAVTNRTSLIANRSSVFIAKSLVRERGETPDDTWKSSSGCSSGNDSDAENITYSAKKQQQSPQLQYSRKKIPKTLKHKHTNKLCTIAANIWGTRFKFLGNSSYLPEYLGTVTYKTSFLHLQPRQMTVTVCNKSTVDNSNKEFVLDSHQSQKVPSTCNFNSSIPIAPMSPQLKSVHSILLLSEQNSNKKQNDSTTAKTIFHSSTSPSSIRHSPRTSHRHHKLHRHDTNNDSSAANSSSTSPINLSRSTSPAASLANFIRPISPPCIKVKEPLSPKFNRALSTSTTSYRHCSSANTTSLTTTSTTTVIRHHKSTVEMKNVQSTVANIDASTSSATKTLLIDDSSGYDSEVQKFSTSDIQQQRPENCFEPDTYRDSYVDSNFSAQQKLSLSDPTLNQTTKLNNDKRLNQQKNTISSPKQSKILEHASSSSLQHQQISTNDEHSKQREDENQDEIQRITDNDIGNQKPLRRTPTRASVTDRIQTTSMTNNHQQKV
ncbi:unnamed protein product [Didymodactylos carnosus]|uniref:SOCS box domain-containing protein n=1 Tax=Didymodactylos carnosus TaxID=1234261 RepID=A0A814M1K8_9BILA|nr:unnamed protein product [Didymodactylos carnosus]CAF1215954.1 unnamed protein product [Didymodactylos carnosus]CAF3840504.1 unnamed protein product [Didymodactylos carnosus]CAF4024473.1 unnamed protein product [Didymodactylos carnosus]